MGLVVRFFSRFFWLHFGGSWQSCRFTCFLHTTYAPLILMWDLAISRPIERKDTLSYQRKNETPFAPVAATACHQKRRMLEQ